MAETTENQASVSAGDSPTASRSGRGQIRSPSGPAAAASQPALHNPSVNNVTLAQPISQEVQELLSELKDTVKQLSARRLNTKSLRRSLISVQAILDDIDTLLQPPTA
ncbi:hypothetical protein [Methylomonas sp. HYX-M1]|uniref:hypothetical protein n=1 Tax=Methylomonas sp. HYX-M1 TaxID=3139307 RepID=UPI00345BC112